MIGAIGAIGGYDSIFSIGYSARAAATSSDFSIPESAITGAEAAQQTPATPAQDPIQDSVQLSRDYPQLVVGQTYAPPMEQQIAFAIQGAQQGTGMAASDEDFDYLEGSNTLYEGRDILEKGQQGDSDSDEVTIGEAEGEDGEEAVDETGRQQTDAKGEKLSEEEQQEVKELAKADREVRAHEQAHKSVGGAHAGGMSFGYQQGPDGQRYAVSGEVSIDISAASDPSATVAKMQQVRAAAMAPAQPSPQDYKVAAQAMQQEAKARQEMGSSGAVEGTGESEGEDGETKAVGEGEENGDDTNRLANGGGVSGLGGDGDGESSGDGVSVSSSSSSSSVPTGGVASLRGNSSSNRLAQRYAQMQMAADQPLQMGTGMDGMMNGGYRSINVVA